MKLLNTCAMIFILLVTCPVDAVGIDSAADGSKAIKLESASGLRGCFARALRGHSQRNTDFFLKTKNFLNKKKLLVNHSILSEKRLCDDINFCKQTFPQDQEDTPECEML